jgi:hypothetical protein
MTYQLTASDWTEVRRIADDLMDAVMAGSIASASGQASIKRHIEIILSREIVTAQADYDAQVTAEETHRNTGPQQWEDHPISHCAPAYCGRYAGQRRDSRPEATS